MAFLQGTKHEVCRGFSYCVTWPFPLTSRAICCTERWLGCLAVQAANRPGSKGEALPRSSGSWQNITCCPSLSDCHWGKVIWSCCSISPAFFQHQGSPISSSASLAQCPKPRRRQLQRSAGQGAVFPLHLGNLQPGRWGCSDLRLLVCRHR